jgi:lauroyl/myristoyl acyltransferase
MTPPPRVATATHVVSRWPSGRHAWAVLRSRFHALLDERSPLSLIRIAGLTLSSCYGESVSSGRLRQLARECFEAAALREFDHVEMALGRGAHDQRNVGALNSLKERGEGAVVASIHLGPNHYVGLALLEMGFDVALLADDHVAGRIGHQWQAIAARTRGRLEIIPAFSSHGLLRAVRAVRRGAVALVYIDGGAGARGNAAAGTRQVHFRFREMPVRVHAGAAHLAQRCGVTTVLGAAWRDRAGRRFVEFSDAIAPPARDEVGGAERMLREMVPWFLDRIERQPEQWGGWLLPALAWTETGAAPKVTRELLESTTRRVQNLLDGRGGAARLAADDVRVAPLQHDDSHLIVDGGRRLVLESTPLGLKLLREAQRGSRLATLARKFPAQRAGVEREVTRMVLAGLARIEGGDGA